MRRLVPFCCGLLLVAAPAQDWVRHRGPGDLLPPALGGAANGMADLTVWQFAWEFQRDALTAPRRVGEPLPAPVLDGVVSALRAQSGAGDAELALLSLWGLARMARRDEGVGKTLREVVLGAALKRSAPVGEVAALALGLAAHGDKAAIAALRDLANDTAAGRAFGDQAAVPERTRCFALYGLGLAAENGHDAELQFRVLAAVERLLLPTADTPTQVRIAALHALLLVQLDAAPNLPGPALALLEQQWSLVEPKQLLSVRAQVPLAAAAMLRPADAAAEQWRHRLLVAVAAAETAPAVTRSCAQALGRLCRPIDETTCAVLREVAKTAKDTQTRNLAFFALGTIGGAPNEAWLMDQLGAKGAGFLDRPWIALGLGAGSVWRGEAVGTGMVATLEQAVKTPNPTVFGAFALGLGLARSRSSAPLLAELLRRHTRKGDYAAPFCTALGMVGDAEAIPLLQEVATVGTEPQLCAEAMAAMALLGPAGEAALRDVLLDATVAGRPRHAAAAALRGRADVRSVDSLARTLAEASAPIEQRRFAAFALGSLCDRSARHWSAKLASSIDYRGATPVLVGLPNGVLRLP